MAAGCSAEAPGDCLAAAAAGLLSAAESEADPAFSAGEEFVAALKEVADGRVAAFGSGCFGDELTGAAAVGVAALAADNGFAVGTVDETGVTLGKGCLDDAFAGPWAEAGDDMGTEAGVEAGSDASLRLDDGIENGALTAFRANRLGEPASGSESEAGTAGLRSADGNGDASLRGLRARPVEETFAELRLEAEPAVPFPVRRSTADEPGNGTSMALDARCPDDATTGIGANNCVGEVDGVVK